MVKHYSFSLDDRTAKRFDRVCLEVGKTKTRVMEELVVRFIEENS